jgi:hypothetical protein
MTTRPLTPDLAATVAQNLRPRDLAETLATLPADLSVTEWARSLSKNPNGSAWAALAPDGTPVAMGGVYLSHPAMPHLATSWAVGTQRKYEVGAHIYMAAARLHKEYIAKGVLKFQCMCLNVEEYEESSEWLQRLGYHLEGKLAGHGRGGETFWLWGCRAANAVPAQVTNAR